MYQKYLEHRNNTELISNLKKEINDNDDILILNYVIHPQGNKNFDIEKCVLTDFPKPMYITFLKKFIDFGENLHHVFQEYCKLIYILWPQYDVKYENKPKNYPDNEIYELMYTIKYQLKNLIVLLEKKTYRYQYWHYFALLPLLENGLETLIQISKLYYDDAQHGIMFALYQIDPNLNFNVICSIFDYWDKNKNIWFETGTGMIGALRMILAKYDRIGYKFQENKNFMDILNEYPEI